jgi:hypothetical protein
MRKDAPEIINCCIQSFPGEALIGVEAEYWCQPDWLEIPAL